METTCSYLWLAYEILLLNLQADFFQQEHGIESQYISFRLERTGESNYLPKFLLPH